MQEKLFYAICRVARHVGVTLSQQLVVDFCKQSGHLDGKLCEAT